MRFTIVDLMTCNETLGLSIKVFGCEKLKRPYINEK